MFLLPPEQIRSGEVPDQERRIFAKKTRRSPDKIYLELTMNQKTRSLIQELKSKVKSPITGTNEFPNDDAVIDLAVKRLYETLKQQKIL